MATAEEGVDTDTEVQVVGAVMEAEDPEDAPDLPDDRASTSIHPSIHRSVVIGTC